MRVKSALIGILLLSFFVLPLNARAKKESAPLFQQADIIRGEIIIGMKSGKSAKNLRLPEKTRASSKIRKGLEKLNAGVIIVPVGEESKYVAEFKKRNDVLFVEPNYRVTASVIPNDADWNLQYAPALIQAPAAWDITTGSNSVILAIIDSGLDATHPEFNGRITAGYDFVENDAVPQDECGHGTHVAGIAAAEGNNSAGVAGIAWNASIMPLRVLNASCGGSFADVADAIVWATNKGANIINLSAGAPSSSLLVEQAIYYAYTRDVAVFAAAGNTGGSSVFYPAAYWDVMAIGAVDSSPARASFSNYGAALDLMAPGVSIYSTLPTSSGFLYNSLLFGKSTNYDYLDGTSMATPHTAGAAALLASLPALDTPDKIYQSLTDTALDLEITGRDDKTGYGLIQLANALTFTPTIATAHFDWSGGILNASPFCATTPALQHPATLRIIPKSSAPVMPVAFLDLQHYADITFFYAPAPPISPMPMPVVYVCYHYTAQDVLAAGGHPSNLFIAAHDATTNKWQALPTSVDATQSLLMALAPHFSFYGVATLNPSNDSRGLNLPVTGATFSRKLSVVLAALGFVVVFLSGIVCYKKNNRGFLRGRIFQKFILRRI